MAAALLVDPRAAHALASRSRLGVFGAPQSLVGRRLRHFRRIEWQRTRRRRFPLRITAGKALRQSDGKIPRRADGLTPRSTDSSSGCCCSPPCNAPTCGGAAGPYTLRLTFEDLVACADCFYTEFAAAQSSYLLSGTYDLTCIERLSCPGGSWSADVEVGAVGTEYESVDDDGLIPCGEGAVLGTFHTLGLRACLNYSDGAGGYFMNINAFLKSPTGDFDLALFWGQVAVPGCPADFTTANLLNGAAYTGFPIFGGNAPGGTNCGQPFGSPEQLGYVLNKFGTVAGTFIS